MESAAPNTGLTRTVRIPGPLHRPAPWWPGTHRIVIIVLAALAAPAQVAAAATALALLQLSNRTVQNPR